MIEIFVFSTLFLMLFLEKLSPFSSINDNYRWKHATYNLGIKFFNILVIYILFTYFFKLDFDKTFKFSLLNVLNMPYWLETIIAVVLYDLFAYISHFLSHKIPILWRIHRVHHSDTYIDATTGVRKHILEILIANATLVLIIIPFVGVNLQQLVIYRTILAFIEIFNHANISIPRGVDRFLNLFIVSPGMHKVHHSDLVSETDSNYGDVFPFWDKIFRTYVYKEDLSRITFGLKDFSESKWQTFIGMLKTPFV